MVTSGDGSAVSDVRRVRGVNLLRLLLVWTAVSVPVSLAAGSFLAAGGAGDPRPLPVRTPR